MTIIRSLAKLCNLLWFSAFIFVLSGPKPAHAFNLLQDFQDNLAWDIGNAAEGGTNVSLKSGLWGTDELLPLAHYRFLTSAYGLNQQSINNSTNFTQQDMFKLGLSFAYLFRGFKNPPPTAITRLDIGPAIATPLFTQFGNRQPIDVLFDANVSVKFGGTPTTTP